MNVRDDENPHVFHMLEDTISFGAACMILVLLRCKHVCVYFICVSLKPTT